MAQDNADGKLAHAEIRRLATLASTGSPRRSPSLSAPPNSWRRHVGWCARHADAKRQRQFQRARRKGTALPIPAAIPRMTSRDCHAIGFY